MDFHQAFIESSDLLLFDLDGTLYEDNKHFDLFAAKLKNKLPHPKQNEFEEDFKLVKQGKHPLAIGKVYDAKEDLFWTWDPFTDHLSTPENWNGTLAHVQEPAQLEFPASSFDFNRWIAIGDGWWPPYVLAIHHGVPIEQCHEAYNETKVDMAKEEGYLTKTPGLHTYLKKLKETKKIVLMTNSDQEDVERLLDYLNLKHLFDAKITSSSKPVETKKHFLRILKDWNVKPEQVTSVGDNFMNEIAPALQLGMKAIWLSPDEPAIAHQHLWTVSTLQTIIKPD